MTLCQHHSDTDRGERSPLAILAEVYAIQMIKFNQEFQFRQKALGLCASFIFISFHGKIWPVRSVPQDIEVTYLKCFKKCSLSVNCNILLDI